MTDTQTLIGFAIWVLLIVGFVFAFIECPQKRFVVAILLFVGTAVGFGVLSQIEQETERKAAEARREQIERNERAMARGEDVPPGGVTKEADLAAQQPKRTTWRADELVVVKGNVVERKPEGVVVNSFVSTYSASNYEGRRSAGAGAGDVSRLAELAIREQEGVGYGNLMRFKGGNWSPANFQPEKKTTGTIMLQGFPENRAYERSGKIHVLAAPVRQGVYTLDFQLEAESSPRTTQNTYITKPLELPRPKSRDQQNDEILRKYGAPAQ